MSLQTLCIHGLPLNIACDKCENEERGRPHPQDDMVNCPPHYNQGKVECIDAIEAALTPEEFVGYCKGNVMKYTWRSHFKGQFEDLKKARWYLNRLVG